jgi:aminoglycoside phosphotransferase (APT) family kinase protein
MMHDDQLSVDAGLVRRLIADQFPAWAGLPVVPVRSGATVNAIFRLGDGLAARLPLRAADAEAVRAELEREAAALEELARIIAVPVPRPVVIGRPGRGYPLPWAVHEWLPSSTTTPTALAGSAAFADDLAPLLLTLRAAPTRAGRSRAAAAAATCATTTSGCGAASARARGCWTCRPSGPAGSPCASCPPPGRT